MSKSKKTGRVNRIVGCYVEEVTDQDIDELVEFMLRFVVRMISSTGFRSLISTVSQLSRF